MILGAVGQSRGERNGVVALVVGALGLVVGMFLGLAVFAASS